MEKYKLINLWGSKYTKRKSSMNYHSKKINSSKINILNNIHCPTVRIQKTPSTEIENKTNFKKTTVHIPRPKKTDDEIDNKNSKRGLFNSLFGDKKKNKKLNFQKI